MFDTTSQKSHTMMTGSHASLSSTPNRIATLRKWTVKVGHGVEYHHNNTLLVRDVSSGKTALELDTAVAEPIAWSPDGVFLAAGERRGLVAGAKCGSTSVGIWDVRTGKHVGRVIGHIDVVTHVAVTSDLRLVTLSRDGTVRMTDAATGKTQARLEVAVHNPRMLTVSATGKTIVSLWGNTVNIWVPDASHLTSYDLKTTRATEGWPLCMSSNCRWMACRTEDGFDIVELSSGAVVWEERQGGAPVTAAAFSANSDALLIGRMNGALEVWDVVCDN